MRRPCVPASWRGLVVGLLTAAAPALVLAEPVALDDEALAEVTGEGIGLGVHLELNADLLLGAPIRPNLVASFGDPANPVYLTMHGVGGIMDMYAVTLRIETTTSGQDVLALGLPGFVGFQQFGVRAISVQTDPTAAPGAGNFGSLWLDGIGAMTGRVLMWSR